jgi:transposase
MTQTNIATAGIDTSKLKLDIAVHGRTERWQLANAQPGWRALADNLAKAGVTRVGIEATGGYGRVHLRRAKNDALDAALIAACAATLDQPRIAPDPRLTELAGYLTFVEQTEEDIARFKTRLEHIDEPQLRRIVTSDIKRLKARRNTRTNRAGLARASLHNISDIPGIQKLFLSQSLRTSEQRLIAALRKAQQTPLVLGPFNLKFCCLNRISQLLTTIRDRRFAWPSPHANLIADGIHLQNPNVEKIKVLAE